MDTKDMEISFLLDRNEIGKCKVDEETTVDEIMDYIERRWKIKRYVYKLRLAGTETYLDRSRFLKDFSQEGRIILAIEIRHWESILWQALKSFFRPRGYNRLINDVV